MAAATSPTPQLTCDDLFQFQPPCRPAWKSNRKPLVGVDREAIDDHRERAVPGVGQMVVAGNHLADTREVERRKVAVAGRPATVRVGTAAIEPGPVAVGGTGRQAGQERQGIGHAVPVGFAAGLERGYGGQREPGTPPVISCDLVSSNTNPNISQELFTPLFQMNRHQPHRRAFIAHSAWVALGAVLVACGHNDGIGSVSERNRKVVIVGAGIAGLAAAAELKAGGFRDVVILEARDRIGGRIWTGSLSGGIPVDLGASWIHGVKDNPITEIARDNNIEVRRTNYRNEAVHARDGGQLPLSGGDIPDGFWRLAGRHPGASLQAAYDEYLKTRDFSDAEKRYLAYLLNTTIEHDYAADISDLSLESVEGGSAFGGHDVVFPGGYRQIIDTLADNQDILLGHAVTGIDYAGTPIVVTTARGATFEADRVIVTAPLGVLKKGLVSFSPALPPRKQKAIDSLEMGVLNKTCLLFDDVFWDRDIEFIGYVGTTKGRWAETLNLYPYTGQPILMMFNAASYGTQVERLSNQEIVAQATTTLADMYGTVPKPQDALITRWRSDPWAYGSYSYVPVGAAFQQYADLGTPVNNRLFFAGEATHDEYPSTVHGAFLSGLRAARQLSAGVLD